MYEIILVVCMVATPAHCEEQRPEWQEAYSMASCLFEGQIRAVEWAERHPNWTVRGWRCGLPRA